MPGAKQATKQARPQQSKQPSKPLEVVHKEESKLGRTIWLVLHVLILFTGIYLMGASLLLKKRLMINRIIYRIDFALVIVNYGMCTFNYLDGEEVRAAALLALGSVQYLILAFMWIFMHTHATKVVPYTMLSLLHVLDAFSPKLAQKYSKPLSLVIGWSNLLIFFKLLLDFIRIRHGGAASLMIYGLFYRFRYAFDPVDRECANTLYEAINKRLSAESTPAYIRDHWKRLNNRIQHYESQINTESRKKEIAAVHEANMGKLD